MKACGESMCENVITVKILRSMVYKFNYVVCSIEESNNLETMTIDELQSSLLVHEQRMNCHREEEQMLQITNDDRGGRGKGRWRGFFKGGQCKGRGRQPLNKYEIECFKSQKLDIFNTNVLTGRRKVNYAEVEGEVDG